MEIVFATQNQNKVREIQKLVPNHTKILSLVDIGCEDDIAETSLTLEGNANIKSFFIFNKYNINCFADDTGLEIESLDGEPGVKSARYADESNKDDNKNIDLVLSNLKNKSNRKAQFRTVISLILNGKELQFEGVIKGNIALERMGEKGFGYDPIFVPEGEDISFAQMSMDQKNSISHRGRAVRKLIEYLNEDTSLNY